ncbi:MAG: hypothetical protein ACI4VT_04885 [Bacilli bacterium]|nr:hypothetical protein [bacterium]MDY3757265.1 hypothetical protein [Bacilli bacterium]
MNNYGAFTRLLFGLNKTLRIAGQVIPIYRDSKPLVKNVYNFVKKKNNKVISNNTSKEISKPEEKKKIIVSNNNPTFFI